MKWSTFTQRRLLRSVFSLEILSQNFGCHTLKASGERASAFFSGEVGCHRWQRVPPTEKRGRVQTSTVTVAVLHGGSNKTVKVDERDLEWDYFRAGGKGGQHQNKTSSACRVTHKPTGLSFESRNHRKQSQNRKAALTNLINKLQEMADLEKKNEINSQRPKAGSGGRAEKIRTYRVQDDTVSDHITGRKTKLSLLYKGNWKGIK